MTTAPSPDHNAGGADEMAGKQLTLPFLEPQPEETPLERKRRVGREWMRNKRASMTEEERDEARRKSRDAAAIRYRQNPEEGRRARNEWVEKHREQVNAAAIEYYWKNAEEIRPKKRKARAENPERYREADRARDPVKRREQAKRRWLENPEKYRERDRNRPKEQKERRAGNQRIRYAKDPQSAIDAAFERHKRRWKIDPYYRLKRYLRSRLHNALKGNLKVGSAVRDLGCAIPEFKAHIESLFQPGMTWDNHAAKGWHLDHIRPLASFDLTDRQQLLQALHYTNYQPLWWVDNFRKGARYTEPETAPEEAVPIPEKEAAD